MKHRLLTILTIQRLFRKETIDSNIYRIKIMKKIIFMGTPEFAVPVLQELINNKFEIVAVVTQPDKIQGRKREIIFSPVKTLALENNLPIYQPQRMRDDYLNLIELGADLIITAAYGQILPKALLDSIPAINVHGSLLPAYRGGAPIQYALFDGLDKTGITIMDMVFKMDAGDIILQEDVIIEEDDNYETLSNKMSLVGSKLLIEALKKDHPRIKQDEELVTFAYTLKREDEFLDFYGKTDNVINHLKGLLPEPGASVEIDEEIYKVYKITKSDIIINAQPGEIHLTNKNMFVKTEDGIIEILEIQAPGKRKMPIRDFLNGQKLINNGDFIERRK